MSKYIANAFQIPNAVVDDLMSRLSPNAFQPPSGGCELKQFQHLPKVPHIIQPPSGGCEKAV